MERRAFVVAVAATVLALPILILEQLPQARAQSADLSVASGAEPAAVIATLATSRANAAPTAAAPPQAALAAAPAIVFLPPDPLAPPPTVAAAAEPAPTTTTTKAPPPPTTAPPTTAPPAPPPTDPPPGNVEEGQASWYHHNPGECAHRTLPFGTVVTVTNLETGGSTTCTVADRGPYIAGRIIDLEYATFALLADPGQGVIPVRITW